MGDIFLKLLNMSITASWLILVVLCIRLLFRKIPKWITCLLWGVVAIRLIFYTEKICGVWNTRQIIDFGKKLINL